MPAVSVDDARRFMVDSLRAVGAPDQAASDQADLLLHADCTGHFSHGINRLVFYINDIQTGACNPSATPEIVKEAAATAWVDGHDALGATVGNFCIELAIRKAKEAGVGWVAAKRCNHFGMAGWWARRAEREGLIGMAFTNSSPVMVPTRAKESALGTNPIGMAAPAAGGDSLVVDMAVTTVACGKIEVQVHKGEPIPEGWALGPDGQVTTDAQLALNTLRLLPLGGFEETSGYKGYGLSSLVETFCSGLSGSSASYQVRGWSPDLVGGPPDLGQCFVAINPDFFAPGFGERVAGCLNHWRGLEPVDPSKPVLAPGDKERANQKKTLEKGYIVYADRQVDTLNDLADKLGVTPIEVLQC